MTEIKLDRVKVSQGVEQVLSNGQDLLNLVGQQLSMSDIISSPLELASSIISFESLAHAFQFSLTPNQTSLNTENVSPSLAGSFDHRATSISIGATLLNRPLVLNLLTPLMLPPQSQLDITCSRPISLTIHAHLPQSEVLLCQVPTKPMRLTTYGKVTSPMISYYWVSPITTQPIDGNEALMPIKIYNRAKHQVTLRRITIFRDFLKLYQSSSGFVTNSLKLLISSQQEAYVEYGQRPPKGFEDLKLIAESVKTSQNPLGKLFRLMSKRGTGIEYGF